jgi:hypothetical protein
MSGFRDGFDTFVSLNDANIGAVGGAEYIHNIEAAIDRLSRAINDPARKIDNASIDSLKGFVAEWWHEGTYNVDAALKGVKSTAYAPDNNGLVDISLSSGKDYSSKYYKFGDQSALQQAKSNLERYKEYAAQYRSNHNGESPPTTQEQYLKDKYPNDPYYLGQGRLIPADQMSEAQECLRRAIAKEANGGRPEQVARYQQALDKLTDRLKGGDGAESIPLTEQEAKDLAKLAKEAGFDPKSWGLSTEELVSFDYIMNQAFKAGLTAAAISVVLKIAPEVCGIVARLIKNGEVGAEDFKRLGFAALQGGVDGFVRGTVAGAITAACKAGMLETTLKGVNPSIIGAVTAITMNTIQNACMLSFGKMTKSEFAEKCTHDFFVAGASVGLGVVGSIVGGSFSFGGAAVLGYMVGSFVGSVVGEFAYRGVYSCVLSFCVDSGCTFFGIVEQNYDLPKDVLEEIGINVFEYEKFSAKQFSPQKFEPKRFESRSFNPVEIGVSFLRRGVVGVNCIGYV